MFWLSLLQKFRSWQLIKTTSRIQLDPDSTSITHTPTVICCLQRLNKAVMNWNFALWKSFSVYPGDSLCYFDVFLYLVLQYNQTKVDSTVWQQVAVDVWTQIDEFWL